MCTETALTTHTTKYGKVESTKAHRQITPQETSSASKRSKLNTEVCMPSCSNYFLIFDGRWRQRQRLGGGAGRDGGVHVNVTLPTTQRLACLHRMFSLAVKSPKQTDWFQNRLGVPQAILLGYVGTRRKERYIATVDLTQPSASAKRKQTRVE